MLTEQTLTRLRALKLDGMARAFEEQLAQPASTKLSFEERTAFLVDREFAWRDTRRVERLLKLARLKYPQACLEGLEVKHYRGLDASLLASLANCDWIRAGQATLITGSTGLGKTWLACALANQACRQGFSVLYFRFPRLLEELRIAHGDGSFGRRLQSLARADVLLIDDWAIAPTTQSERNDLLEVLDDRTTRSTIITSQLPVERWHEYFNDPTLADAILDRLIHHSHRIALKAGGHSLRQELPMKKQP